MAIKPLKAAALFAALVSATPLAAQQQQEEKEETKVEVTAGADAYRFDNFRGLIAPEGAVIAPWGSVSYKNLRVFGVTTHYTEGNGDVDAGEPGSALLDIDYLMPIGENLSASLGYEILNFRAFDISRSQALRGSLRNSLELLTLGVDALYDFDAGSGLHAEFYMEHDAGPVRMRMSAGYNNGYFREGSGVGYAEGRVYVPLEISSLFVEPMVGYIAPLADGFEHGLNFGVSVSKKVR